MVIGNENRAFLGIRKEDVFEKTSSFTIQAEKLLPYNCHLTYKVFLNFPIFFHVEYVNKE